MGLKIVTNPSEISEDKWLHFVEEHPNGNIFQAPYIYRAYQDTKTYQPVFLSLIDEEGNILGILISVIQNFMHGFLRSFSTRAVIWGGPLVKGNQSEYLEIIIQKYDEIIKNKAIYTEVRNLFDTSNNTILYEKYGYRYEEHLNILVDLTIGEEALWKGLKKRRKEGIRKAKRNNLIFELTNSKDIIPTFYDLLKITYNHAKLPHPPIDFFYSLYNNLPPDNIKIFTLRKESKILIVLVSLIFNNCLYAFLVGTNREKKYLLMKPVDLLYWEVMLWGIENGCHIFDWLGAGNPKKEYGVRKFKLQYGGEILELGRYEKTHKPFMMKIATNGFKIWQSLKYKKSEQ